MHHRAKDYTGQKFGYLTAIRYAGSDGQKSQWEFECELCGSVTTKVPGEVQKQMKRAAVVACGCLKGTTGTTHGMSKHPAYAVWRSMIDRCRLPTHPAWKNYGGRGIEVCPRWHTFSNFWTDMGPTYQSGLTLDRKDNDSDYTPENCRWVTRMAQARNQRRNVVIDTPWGTMTVAEASARSGIGATTLHYRLDNGVTGSDLFTTPDARNQFTT